MPRSSPSSSSGRTSPETAQFVESGGRDIGVLALLARHGPRPEGEGAVLIFPPSAYQPIRQGGVILNWAADRPAAERLRDHLLSEPGRTAPPASASTPGE